MTGKGLIITGGHCRSFSSRQRGGGPGTKVSEAFPGLNPLTADLSLGLAERPPGSNPSLTGLNLRHKVRFLALLMLFRLVF